MSRSAQSAKRSTAALQPAGEDPAAERGPRWTRRKESRPSELLDAALAVFVERGFAATRLEDVAAHAGVSKGTLYLYYANKEELFKAVVRQNIVSLIEQYRASIAQSTRPASELLHDFVHAWWQGFGDTPLAGIAKLCIGEAGNFPEVARFLHEEVIGPQEALLMGIIDRGIASAEWRAVDVHSMAHQIMAPLVLKAIWRRSIEPCCSAAASLDPERFIVHHLESTLRALAPDRPDPGRPVPGQVPEG
ncbi:MAG: TetR/AcrR family transcriptional regulator [Lautropia sp.]